jgi:hypothetical protein
MSSERVCNCIFMYALPRALSGVFMQWVTDGWDRVDGCPFAMGAMRPDCIVVVRGDGIGMGFGRFYLVSSYPD